MILAKIVASRFRVWLAGRVLDASYRLRRVGLALIESEERRWGLSPRD